MERFKAWLAEKPWHMWAMLAFTALLVFFAWRNYRNQQAGNGLAAAPTTGAGVDQNTEILAELKAIGDYISSRQTPNPPGSSEPLISNLGVASKGTPGLSDNFWIPGSDPTGHPGAPAPGQGQSFRQWISSLWQAGWIKPSGNIQTSDQAAQFFATYRNNGQILANIDSREGYTGNPLDTPLAAGQQFAI